MCAQGVSTTPQVPCVNKLVGIFFVFCIGVMLSIVFQLFLVHNFVFYMLNIRLLSPTFFKLSGTSIISSPTNIKSCSISSATCWFCSQTYLKNSGNKWKDRRHFHLFSELFKKFPEQFFPAHSVLSQCLKTELLSELLINSPNILDLSARK